MEICSNSKDVVKIFKNIKDISISNNPDDGNVNIFMCPINARKFDYNKISSVLVDAVIDYALSKRTIKCYKGKYGTLSQQARSKLRKHIENNGELGELLLFCFLEGHLGAPKILTKLEMKTSNNMYVNGSDGVHLLKINNDRYKIIFGESKLYNNLLRALRNAFESIYQFVREVNSSGEYKSGIIFEKSLISSNIENGDFSKKDKEILESIIYPSRGDASLNIDDAFSIFIGYEVDISKETKDCSDEQFYEVVKEKILSELKEIEHILYDKICNKKLLGHSFYVYIVPFTDIDNTRKNILEDILK
ncbi:MAG: DUF1837 domain-containing protein [Fenollaria massiliensis]|uniref:DUF1837 domain-containing protein n=1 Tax=Fenollaria massiliensis TaxID=938288 RepID=A0A9E7DJZ5_9FIRM|nr:DUF1837 domain-containing protein [Fenollaria massiliensis]UQK59239.1 DUF1837 domain-containing protein [Fenollaria massiliensis]